jgi:PilZ domain
MALEPGRDAQPLAKKRPTVALVSLDKQSHETLQDCFSQFAIDVIAATDSAILKKEKLEGCVVSLANANVEDTVAQARNSAWQKRMVIYAIGQAAEMRNLGRYGVNVIMDAPVARPAALKAIHATRLLLLNELRRYVRLPLATPVEVTCNGSRYGATSAEISAGGMSLKADHAIPPLNSTAYASFAIPGSSQLNLAANVCWTDAHSHQFGLKFEPGAPGREAIRTWIEDYLDLD